MQIRRTFLYKSALSALLIGGAVGCSPEITDYCENKVACERGNEYDEDACIEEMKAEEDVADVYGCKSQYEGQVQCLNDFSVCEPYGSSSSYGSPSSSYGLSYEDEYSDEYSSGSESSYSDTTAYEPGNFTLSPSDACSAASQAYYDCMDAANADSHWW